LSARIPGGVEAADTPLSATAVVDAHRTRLNHSAQGVTRVHAKVPQPAGDQPPDRNRGVALPTQTAPAQSLHQASSAQAHDARPLESGDQRSPHAVDTPKVKKNLHGTSSQLAALVQSWDTTTTHEVPAVPARTNPIRAMNPASSPREPEGAERHAPHKPTATTPPRGDDLLAAAVGRVLTSELRRYGIEVEEP
jgi:hypothetical protein